MLRSKSTSGLAASLLLLSTIYTYNADPVLAQSQNQPVLRGPRSVSTGSNSSNSLTSPTALAPVSIHGAAPENKEAAKAITLPLKTRIPVDSKKEKYILELRASQEVRPLGQDAVLKVTPPPTSDAGAAYSGQSYASDNGVSDSDYVPLPAPPLQALISVNENLSPFSMDADFTERVSLPEALRCALGENLTIENSFAVSKAQKFTYLSSLSKFLPSLNGGYTLVGVKGSLPGALLGGAGQGSVSLPSGIQLLNGGFSFAPYQGGRVMFGALEQKHRYRASLAGLKGSVNDILLDTAKKYYDLLYNEALLNIRTRAVAISDEQVRLNQSQEKAGLATGLDVLQSQSQLASDEQNLIDQQNTRRQSSLQLSHVINASLSQDLVSSETELRKHRLVDRSVPVTNLLKIAVDNRPELKQYEELRLAAKRAIVVQGATLQPKANLSGGVFGIGVGSGSLTPLYNLQFGVSMALGSLGTTDIANMQQAKWQARQAAIRAKQAFVDVFHEVRSSYDQSMAADKRIERASVQIKAAEEELRIASKRMQTGIGLNIDVLNAQRDLTQAGINKARALVDFNVAQVQMLRDIGLISADTVAAGVKL